MSSTIRTVDESNKMNLSGDYRIVAWDMDTTGKRLYDEICHIAGYTPDTTFQQYIMPFNNLNYTSIKRHNIRVITIGNFRMLKNIKTKQMLKTKSAVSTLKDFIIWLKSVKDKSDGIILIHHEFRKINTGILLNALTKYNLIDEFCNIVKGFVNGFDIAKAKCDDKINAYSIRSLSRVLLNEKKDVDSADVRANLSYRILDFLSENHETNDQQQSDTDNTDNNESKKIFNCISEFIQPINDEKKEFESIKLILDRQFSLKPIFFVKKKSTRRERQYLTPLRRLLAESKIDYELLKKTWNENGEMNGICELIKNNLIEKDENKISDILKNIENYFEREKSNDKSELLKKNQNNNNGVFDNVLSKMSGLTILD